MKFVIFCVLVLHLCGAVWGQEKKAVESKVLAKKEKLKAKPPLEKASTPRNPTKIDQLVCPGSDIPTPFFTIPCKVTEECAQLGNKMLRCCNNKCLKGVPAPPQEPVHTPLFGFIERVCPSALIPEIFEIKKCTRDDECSPRICCPEKLSNGDVVGYCRTAEPKWDRLPVVRPLTEPFKLIMSYMQCAPPPPPLLDLFPKQCGNPLDCFPNLCCQEGGKRFCRPARRSLLTLLTTVAQRIVPTETARDIINRLAP